MPKDNDDFVTSLLNGLRQNLRGAKITKYSAGAGDDLAKRINDALKQYLLKLDIVERFVNQANLPDLKDVVNQLGELHVHSLCFSLF